MIFQEHLTKIHKTHPVIQKFIEGTWEIGQSCESWEYIKGIQLHIQISYTYTFVYIYMYECMYGYFEFVVFQLRLSVPEIHSSVGTRAVGHDGKKSKLEHS